MEPIAAARAWEELTREEILRLAPDALVVVPLGAIEQHGPFLPTGTDSLLSMHAVRLAADAAARAAGVNLLLAPFLRIGSSDHHLPFGGTISLPPATLLQVLTDAIRSMAHSGVRRVVLVNGHGGNTGICHAAAAAISTTSPISVAAVDYWEHGGDWTPEVPVPGHAGRWETALMLSLRADLVKAPVALAKAPGAREPGRGVYSAAIWKSIDGYTDRPDKARAQDGAATWDLVAAGLADRLVQLAEAM